MTASPSLGFSVYLSLSLCCFPSCSPSSLFSPLVQIRLTGGRTRVEGRVEVLAPSGNITLGWGLICGDGWTTREAMVVCRQLGLTYAGSGLRVSPEGCIGEEERRMIPQRLPRGRLPSLLLSHNSMLPNLKQCQNSPRTKTHFLFRSEGLGIRLNILPSKQKFHSLAQA